MNTILAIIQTPSGRDIVDVGTAQYTIGGVMMLFIIYLAWSKWESSKKTSRLLQQKDAQIMKVVNEHRSDLKENNKDYQQLVDKYHVFTEQIRAIASGK